MAGGLFLVVRSASGRHGHDADGHPMSVGPLTEHRQRSCTPATAPSTAFRPQCKLAGHRRSSSSPSSPRPRSAFWAFGVYAVLVARRRHSSPGCPARVRRSAAAHRGPLPRVRPASCRSSGRCARIECSACRCPSPGLWARLEHPRQGNARRPRHHRPRGDHPGRRAPVAASNVSACPRCSSAIAGFMIRYLDVDRWRAAPACTSPAIPAATTRGGLAGQGDGVDRPARSSSGPTSAANGCTSRWLSRGYAGSLPAHRRAPASAGGLGHGRCGAGRPPPPSRAHLGGRA